MTKHIKMIAVSLVVTLIVLFGGYQSYQYLKVKKPLIEMMEAQKDITIRKIEMKPDSTEVQLTANPSYDFINKFPDLSIQLNEKLGEGKWRVTFTNPPTPKVKNAWQEMVFGVKEGLETGKYTLIQSTVKQSSLKYKLLYHVYIDDQYVYLSLQEGNKTWYQILPIKAVN
jgi:hypothetical protein